MKEPLENKGFIPLPCDDAISLRKSQVYGADGGGNIEVFLLPSIKLKKNVLAMIFSKGEEQKCLPLMLDLITELDNVLNDSNKNKLPIFPDFVKTLKTQLINSLIVARKNPEENDTFETNITGTHQKQDAIAKKYDINYPDNDIILPVGFPQKPGSEQMVTLLGSSNDKVLNFFAVIFTRSISNNTISKESLRILRNTLYNKEQHNPILNKIINNLHPLLFGR